MAISIVGATAVTLAATIGSAIYLDKVLGPLLRGTGWEFLAIPCIVSIVWGGHYVWIKAFHIIDGALGRGR